MESYKTHTCKKHRNLGGCSSFLWLSLLEMHFSTWASALLEVSGRTARLCNKERSWPLGHWESSSFPYPMTAHPHLSQHPLEGSSIERECWVLGDLTLLFILRGLPLAGKLQAFLGLLLPLKLPFLPQTEEAQWLGSLDSNICSFCLGKVVLSTPHCHDLPTCPRTSQFPICKQEK